MKIGISKECFLYIALKIYVSNKFFAACEVLKQISLILKKEAFTEKSSESSILLIEKQTI